MTSDWKVMKLNMKSNKKGLKSNGIEFNMEVLADIPLE